MSKPPEIVTYVLRVSTSSIYNAGTSANVFVQIFGKHGRKLWTTKFPLIGGRLKQRPDRTEVYEIDECDVGELTKLRISHDGKAGWHLKRVVVEKLGEAWLFKCGRWIHEGEHLDLNATHDE